MTLKKTEVYAKNISEQPQTIVHPGLSQFVVVPVAPGGYTLVTNQRVTIEPGQCFRVPMQLWNQGRPICKLAWTQEISREEFEEALCPGKSSVGKAVPSNAELTDSEEQKQKEAANPPAQANDASSTAQQSASSVEPAEVAQSAPAKPEAAKKATPVKAKGTGAREKAAAKKAAPVK
jgi:hypothetical protein